MKIRIVQIILISICTVFAAALQDMSPTFGGIKPPLLLAFTLYRAFTERRSDAREYQSKKTHSGNALWIFAAILAGIFEDALSGFPLGCATGFLLFAGIAARLLRTAVPEMTPVALGLVTTMVAAPFHEIWLFVWDVTGSNPSLLVRFFASTLPAAPVGAAVFMLMPVIERHAGFHGPEIERRMS